LKFFAIIYKLLLEFVSSITTHIYEIITLQSFILIQISFPIFLLSNQLIHYFHLNIFFLEVMKLTFKYCKIDYFSILVFDYFSIF